MCFSASASFGAGVVLSVIGVASIKKVRSPSQNAFASIPLIFALQQITEGFVWLSFTHASFAFVQEASTYIFLFFAQIIWPIWVPYSILILKKKEKRQKIEKLLVGVGGVVSLYLAYCLWCYPVEAKAIGYHISYSQHYPSQFSLYGGVLYIIATIVPPFFSNIKRMWALGTAILISYIITAIFYEAYIISVWCFFASVISIAVYAVMHRIKTSDEFTKKGKYKHQIIAPII
ncbi:MAG: DUF6629 family protein [Bacteroidota bacterium]|nr:DUF6629 family protein [Bacteroidota bacterium]